MLGKTSLSALRALVHLAQQEHGACLSPRRLAETIGESPTYLAKVLRHLVRGGMLRAEKGVKGGVVLAMPPERITLLAVVEACHGAIVGDYCNSPLTESTACNFHRAALELHRAVTGILGRWTIADLLERPHGHGEMMCVMVRGRHPSVSPFPIALGAGQQP